jgi:hypothetical protein
LKESTRSAAESLAFLLASIRVQIVWKPWYDRRSAIHNESNGEVAMPLVTVVLTLAVVGVLLWLVNRFIPMQSTIKGILNAVVVIAVVLWLLKVFDLFNYVTQFKVGH